jgi:decaprenylphospho-beta-D-erythro-pentofuranosid-2-ulose 2-reductase
MTVSRIVIAGATSAIAQAAARQWARRGATLFLVARDAQKLAAVQADLRARGAQLAGEYIADLRDTAAHEELRARALAGLGTIDALLIAHGSLGEQHASERSAALALDEMQANFASAVSLLTVFANHFEAAGAGTIAAIGSVAGDRGRASNYVYGAAKGGLAIFLAGLRARLAPKGVRVVTIKPGFVDTPMTADFTKGALWSSPERAAAGVVSAMDRGVGVAYVPGYWRWIMLVIRLIPEPIFIRMKL